MEADYFTPSPLPGFESPRIHKLGWKAGSDHHCAYDNILQAEQRALATPSDTNKLTSVRVAGFTLLEFSEKHDAFGLLASETFAKWLMSLCDQDSNQDDVIIGSGAYIRDNLFRTFCTTTTSYSQLSSPSSCESVDDLQEIIQTTPSKNYDASMNKVLVRDGWRCVITGIANRASLERYPELKEQMPKNVIAFPLQTAHIFNESGAQTHQTGPGSHALVILNMFGYRRLAEALIEENAVHKTWNLLLLQRDLCSSFDNFELWFEATDQPHRYKVCTFQEHITRSIHVYFDGADRGIAGAPMFVEFNAQLPEAPPPDPELLELHAICSRVAHASGADEFFSQMERDPEDTMILASEGSSTRLPSSFAIPEVA